MLYEQHDIIGNYMRAGASGERKVQKDIILSEISKMVALCPDCVVSLLNKAGIETKSGISNRSLVKKVSDALNTNLKFARMMIVEILSTRKSASGGGNGGVPKKTADRIVRGVGVVFGANGNATSKNNAESELLKKTETIREMNGLSSNIGKYIGWSLFIGASVGVVIYFYNK